MGRYPVIKSIFLLIIIAASIVVIIKYGFRKNPGAPKKTTAYICTTCGSTVEISTESTTDFTKDNMMKCPTCGTYTAKKANTCVFCGKSYLVDQSLQKYGEKYRCIHCGKSLNDQGEQNKK